MIKYCVIYYGKPEAPVAFDDYYWNHHLPLVIRWPKLKRLVVSKGQPGDEIYQMAEIHFDSREDLDLALHSPERAVTGQDVKNFPKVQRRNQAPDFRGGGVLERVGPRSSATLTGLG